MPGSHPSAGRTPVDTPLAVVEDELSLVVLEGPARGRRYPVNRDSVLGRNVEADVLVDDPEVSRKHARIARDAGAWLLEDLGSRNGTYLNGVPVQRALLAFGDKIRLGSVVLVVSRHNPLEQQLRQRQRLETLGRLAAGITHDMNNMQQAVAATVAFLEGLPSETTLDDAGVLECLRDLAQASERSQELASCLLGYARSGDETHSEVDLSQVCREVARLAARTFGTRITVSAEVRPELRVLGSAAELHQVVMNLCVNARDAMPDGGELRIAAALYDSADVSEIDLDRGSRWIRVTVKDDGVGMDARTRARAFEAFFTTKKQGQGAGLGLAMVHDIVVSHGGRVACDSRPGEGSTFRVYLPASDSAGVRSRALTGPGVSAQSAAQEARILLVEDEPLVRKSLQRVLCNAGYQVTTACDGLEAIELYGKGPRPQLVMLDLQMPRMSGPDALAELRLLDGGVRVLFITGQPDDTVERMARAYGVGVGTLRKPFSSDELLEAVARALRASREIDDTLRTADS